MKGFYEEITPVDLQESIADLGNVDGFEKNRAARGQRNVVRLSETARLWESVIKEGQDPILLRAAFAPHKHPYVYRELNRRHPMTFNESMTTSDFAFLTDNLLDRAILAMYQAYPYTWDKVAHANRNIKDFRSVKRYTIDGGQGVYGKVGEKEGFDRRKFVSGGYTYFVEKYAAGYELSWESVINDDLSGFATLPQRLANGGSISVEKAVTAMYCGLSGPDSTLYTTPRGNIIAANAVIGTPVNPPLSIQALQAALAQMMGKTDIDGVPIPMHSFTLVVGSGSTFVIAQNIKNMLLTDITVVGGTTGERLRTTNWLQSSFEVVFNPYIPLIATTANSATSWWLFATPSVGRPALEMGFLQGYDTPQLFRKNTNTSRVGGGLDQTVGDFDTMSTEYKAVIVYGGTQMDYNATMASNGSGV